MGISSPRKSKRLTDKSRCNTPQNKKGRDPYSRTEQQSSRKNAASSLDGSNADEKRSPENPAPSEHSRRGSSEAFRSTSSPAPKRTPEKARIPAHLLGSPFPMLESPLNTPLMSPARPLPLFQDPSPRRGPMSPAHQFSVNYHALLSSPAGTPADLADMMRYSFDTPASSKLPLGLSLSELFSSPSPQLHGKLPDRAAEDNFFWEDLAAKIPDGHEAAPKPLTLKDNEDMSAPWVGTLLVSPSTKDVLASVSLQQQLAQQQQPAPRPVSSVATKRILDFNAAFEEAGAAEVNCQPEDPNMGMLPPASAGRPSRVSSTGLPSATTSRHAAENGYEEHLVEQGASDDDRGEGMYAGRDGPMPTARQLQHNQQAPADASMALEEQYAHEQNLAAATAILNAESLLSRLSTPAARQHAVALLQLAGVLQQSEENSPRSQPQASGDGSAFDDAMAEPQPPAIKAEPTHSPRQLQQEQQQPRVIYHRKPSRLQHQSNESTTPRSLERAVSVTSAGEAHLSVIPPPTPDEAPDGYGPPKTCHCKKSQCLKLYCECFAAGMFCSNCSCSNCQNTREFAAVVMDRRSTIMQRNPEAFRKKITKVEGHTAGAPRHHKGCNCRKSQCLKKYCECFQNGVHCGELCKCLDCANCDAAYALQSSQRMGTRKATAQAGAWHVAPGQDGGPITPFSTRYQGDGVSTPTSTSKSIPDLRHLLNPGSSHKLSFPSTPVSNIQAPSQAGTPPTSVRSDSPATTPRSYPPQPPSTHQSQPSYHAPANRISTRSNLAVSIINISASPSPSVPRNQLVTANQIVANAPLPSSTHSQRGSYPQRLEATCSSPQPEERGDERLGSSFGHAEATAPTRHSHRLDPSTHVSISSVQQQQQQNRAAPPSNPSNSDGAQRGAAVRLGSAGTQAEVPPAASRGSSGQNLAAGNAARSQQAGDDGQVEQGMVIEMQDTETGERYRYYVPTGDSQLTQVVQPDGSVVLMAAPQQQEDNEQRAAEAQAADRQPASLAVQETEAGVQLLQLPDGQLVQISGLEPGQQLVLQKQLLQQPQSQGSEEGARQVAAAAWPTQAQVRGVSAGPSSSGKQHTPMARRHPSTGGIANYMQSEGGEGGYSKGVRQESGTPGAANMEVDGPMLKAEASGSQDENEVPTSHAVPSSHRAHSLCPPERSSMSTMSPVRRMVTRSEHAYTATPHESRAHPSLQDCGAPTGPSPRSRVTPNKRKAADAAPQTYQDADEKVMGMQLPRGTAVRQLSLPAQRPPSGPAAAAERLHVAELPRTRGAAGSSARQATSDLLKEVARKVGGSCSDAPLERPIINVRGMGPVITPTKLTLGAAGLSRLSPLGLVSITSPANASQRTPGQLFRISPGSTTIRPSPGSAEKRHRAN